MRIMAHLLALARVAGASSGSRGLAERSFRKGPQIIEGSLLRYLVGFRFMSIGLLILLWMYSKNSLIEGFWKLWAVGGP